jgi:hypothetical protein
MMAGMKLVALALIILLAPISVSAHSLGISYEEKVDPYIVDIGYDPAVPTVGSRFLLDFTLLDVDRLPVDFDSVWVRLEHEDATILATGVAEPEFGPTTILFIPSAPGTLTVHARYEKGGESLAEVTFPLEVKEARGSVPYLDSLLAGAAGALLGALLMYLALRRRS